MSGASPFEIRSAALTHPGKVRQRNEDAVLDRRAIGLWAVADGMGGHGGGAEASTIVIEQLQQVTPPDSRESLITQVYTRLVEAHNQIHDMAQRLSADGVMGCTAVAVAVWGERFACLWAGDSRLYRHDGNGLTRISHDHSQVQELIDAHVITEAQAEDHPQRNVITRAVGVGELDLASSSGALAPGDVLLLCSDGLTKMVSDRDIAACLAALDDPERCAEALLEQALAHGGRDNVSVVVVRCSLDPCDATAVGTNQFVTATTRVPAT